MKLKFKKRIAYFNTLTVAIITLLVFSVIYFVVHRTAYRHLDSDINLEKEEVLSNLDWKGDSIIINKMPEWDEAEHNKVEVNPTFLQIVDMHGRMIFHSSNLLKDQFLFNPELRNDYFYNGELSGQKIRLGQFPVKNDHGKIIGQLSIAISQQESFTILNNLLIVLLISFPLVLVIQYLASSFAASKAISPVHRLIRTAGGINDSSISTRLELPGHKDELYELTQTINDLLGRIEASLMKQKQFTSDASHEMRTPLAAIRGTLEVLLRKPREVSTYEEKITEVITQVDRLDLLLDQLLQLARIESGNASAKTENVYLNKIADVVMKKWKMAAESRHISLHNDLNEDITVTGDRIFLEIILDNLVSNAIKYGKEGGNVFLHWNQGLRTLFVKDDGPGFSKEQLSQIFDRFYRTDPSRSSAVKGTGLGLSISRKLAELQNLSLRVESQSGAGSTFILNFPA